MRDDFLKMIEADIRADEPKLIFADWLEEQGSDEAEGWRWIVEEKRFPKFVKGRGYIWSYWIPDASDEPVAYDSSWVRSFLWRYGSPLPEVRPGFYETAIEAFCELAAVYYKRKTFFAATGEA